MLHGSDHALMSADREPMNRYRKSRVTRQRVFRSAAILLVGFVAVVAAPLAPGGDPVAPRVWIDLPAEGAAVSRVVTISGTTFDNQGVETVEVQVDEDGSYQLATGTTDWSIAIDLTGYPPGAHTIRARVTDSGGNTGWTSRSITVTDTTSPRVWITEPAEGAAVSGVVTISGGASDDAGLNAVEVQVDEDGSYLLATGTTTWSIAIDLSGYPPGAHTIRARVTDSSGNKGWANRSITVTDTTSPRVWIAEPAEGAAVSGAVTISGTAFDNADVQAVEVQIDDGSFLLATGTTAWSIAIDLSGYPAGAHTIRARVTDSAGNKGWASRSITLAGTTPDRTAPHVWITEPAEGAAVSGVVTISGGATDDVGVQAIEVQVDADGAYRRATGTTSWSAAIDLTGYPAGTHTIRARATDSSGNTESTTRSIVVNGATPDTTPPRVAVFTPADGANVSGTVVVAGVASDDAAVSSVDVRVDDAPYQRASGTTSWSIALDTSAYTDGAHTVVVRATDTSQNSATAAVTLIVANLAPSQVLWGAMVKGANYGYDDPPWDMRSQDLFEQHAGKKASLMGIGALWGGSTPNFQSAAMSTIRSHGSIPFFTWGPYSGGGADEPTYKLSNIINGQFDAYITKFAQDAKAWGQPFFLRFMWEMNGDWYPWSEARNGNQPGDYVKAWRHVHDIFTQVGATNATWVWCVNTEYSGSLPLAGLYPGDAYVDWLSLDGYNKDSTSRSFATIYKPTYDHLLTISSKPIIIGEVASKDSAYPAGTKAAWITDMLTTQLPTAFPRIKGFLWFNWNYDGDFIIESSPTATAAFAAGISSPRYASNTFATLTGTTIQAPVP
jgi:hypothetical protein